MTQSAPWPRPNQNGDVVGAMVGDHEVRDAVAVQIADRDARRVGAHEEAVGGAELVVAQAEVDEDVVARRC